MIIRQPIEEMLAGRPLYGALVPHPLRIMERFLDLKKIIRSDVPITEGPHPDGDTELANLPFTCDQALLLPHWTQGRFEVVIDKCPATHTSQRGLGFGWQPMRVTGLPDNPSHTDEVEITTLVRSLLYLTTGMKLSSRSPEREASLQHLQQAIITYVDTIPAGHASGEDKLCIIWNVITAICIPHRRHAPSSPSCDTIRERTTATSTPDAQH